MHVESRHIDIIVLIYEYDAREEWRRSINTFTCQQNYGPHLESCMYAILLNSWSPFPDYCATHSKACPLWGNHIKYTILSNIVCFKLLLSLNYRYRVNFLSWIHLMQRAVCIIALYYDAMWGSHEFFSLCIWRNLLTRTKFCERRYKVRVSRKSKFEGGAKLDRYAKDWGPNVQFFELKRYKIYIHISSKNSKTS